MTLVVAAMGYGKTNAVRNFLEEIKADYVWLSVESDDTSANIFWDTLTRHIIDNDPVIGKHLNNLGVPLSAADRHRVFDLLEEWTFQQNKILVVDDYHFVDSPELDLLLEKLVRKRINGLHLLIISRRRPSMNIQELQLKGYCHRLKSALFELSQDEISEYFRLYGCDISDATAKLVHTMTEGWIAAVYLVCQRYLDSGRLETGIDLYELINTTILGRYTEKEKRLLMSLSILDSFSISQAVYITKNRLAPGIIHKLSSDSSFIRFDERSQKYYMHNILAGHLRGLLEEQTDQSEILSLYKRSGQWNLDHGHILTGMKLLLKAKEFNLLMQEFEKPSITRILDTATQDIVNLVEQIPPEVKYRHPLAYLTYVDLYLTKVDIEVGARLLAEVETYYQKDNATPPAVKKCIAGEIELIRSFLFFNDISKMHECQQKAHDLLGGSSCIANKDMIFTFGCPSMLYLFHREKGGMLEVVEQMDKAMICYEELSHGCGKGCDSLIRAEYHLEKGELEPVEYYANKAVYKAQTTDQISIILCANLTVARLMAAKGNVQEARHQLDDLAYRIHEYNNPIYNNCLDLCFGYLGGVTGDPHSFSPWLQTGEMKQNEMFYHGLAYNYLVHARYVLLEKDYTKLEVICEEMSGLFSIFNNLLGHLHAHILDAIAKFRLVGMEKAKESLEHALAIGRTDDIVLPFAEYGNHIEEILIALASQSKTDAYLDKLVTATSRYRRNLEIAGMGNPQFVERLTERETEILKLLTEGHPSKEIGERLFIAEITVKKAITSIYRKLGVGSRAAAVRKSIELKLI